MSGKVGQPFSTRDPRHSGSNNAILTRLRDRLKIEVEFSEPGYSGWKLAKTRADLLNDLIDEFERLPSDAIVMKGEDHGEG